VVVRRGFLVVVVVDVVDVVAAGVVLVVAAGGAGVVSVVMGEARSPAAAVVVVGAVAAVVAVADCLRENRPMVSNQMILGVVDAHSVHHRPVGMIDGLGRWDCCRRSRRVLGVGSLAVRTEWMVVGRKALGYVETVEGLLVVIVDRVTRKEGVAGIGRAVERMLIVEVFGRMGSDSGVEVMLWGRDGGIE
jgi:hypothetical protein